MKFHPGLLLLPFTLLFSCVPGNDSTGHLPDFPELSGPFLGQPAPDSIPLLFAPGVVSTGMFTRDMAISPDGKELYFCVAIGNYTYATILCTREVDGRWMEPEIVPFSGGPGVIDFEPAFSPDGSRLYFLSNRPDGEEPVGDQDIWFVERNGDQWGMPQNLGGPVNTDGGEFFPSLTEDGTLYFTRNERGHPLSHIYRSRWLDGAFQEPEQLPVQVNCGTDRYNAFVARDESYVIVPAEGMEDAYDAVDYYIVFRDTLDRWSQPVNMGAAINADNVRGWSPYVTADGKYLFFMATRTDEIEEEQWNYHRLKTLNESPRNGNADIYWVDAGFIPLIRNAAQWPDLSGPPSGR